MDTCSRVSELPQDIPGRISTGNLAGLKQPGWKPGGSIQSPVKMQHRNDPFVYNHLYIWMFPNIVVPQNGWLIMEKLIKMDDLGVPLFLETPICIYNIHIIQYNYCVYPNIQLPWLGRGHLFIYIYQNTRNDPN